MPPASPPTGPGPGLVDARDPHLTARIARCAATRAEVVALSDDELRSAIGHDRSTTGWGTSRIVTLAGAITFAKVVPVTDRELAEPGSTRNHYGIPSYLGYPFGSPGLGVWRELSFALAATGRVEARRCGGFPILVHHRVLERRDVTSAGPAVVPTAYRGDEPTMNEYLADRATARHELVMVFEHVPDTAEDWLLGRPQDVCTLVDDVRRTIELLRAEDVVHFDTDLANILTDGRQAMVTDFGLVLDRRFELTDDEHRFLDRHRHYDLGNLLLGLAHHLAACYRSRAAHERAAIDAAVGTGREPTFEDRVERLLDGRHRLHESGLLPVGTDLLALLDEHEPAIRYMHGFFAEARRHWGPHLRFDDAHLAQLLRGSGYLP